MKTYRISLISAGSISLDSTVPLNAQAVQDQRDTEFVEELMNVLGDEVKEVDSFVIVYKYKDRFTSPFARTLRCEFHLYPRED